MKRIHHKGIILLESHRVEIAIQFKEKYNEDLEKLGYYLIIIPSIETKVKLLSTENVTEVQLDQLLSITK